MTAAVWMLLARYLPHRGRRFLSLGARSVLAGVLEATVLALTVRAAVAIAEPTIPSSRLPWAGSEQSLSPRCCGGQVERACSARPRGSL